MSRNRLGALALAVAGVLFVLYPAVRPWEDESTVDGAIRAMSSGAWVASHLFAMLGFILVSLGVLALRDTIGGALADAALVITWVGAGFTLTFYGAEDYGMHAVAQHAPSDFLAIVEDFRYGTVPITMFGVGLLALAAGTILAAVAIWRSGTLPRYSGILFAVGFVLFLPQFFTPPAVRIGHGVLVAIGCFWLALELWKVRDISRT